MAADSCCSFVGAFLTGQVVVDGAGYRGKKKKQERMGCERIIIFIIKMMARGQKKTTARGFTGTGPD